MCEWVDGRAWTTVDKMLSDGRCRRRCEVSVGVVPVGVAAAEGVVSCGVWWLW